ncbi:hypothetical protein [Nesterenkonia rhizosphaerae]
MPTTNEWVDNLWANEVACAQCLAALALEHEHRPDECEDAPPMATCTRDHSEEARYDAAESAWEVMRDGALI